MEKVLYLTKMGMDIYDKPEGSTAALKSYRDETRKELIELKDGRKMFFSFHYNAKRTVYRDTNKRTGAKLKKTIKEVIAKENLYIDTEYTDENGFSWRDSKIEREVWEGWLYPSEENILALVNKYAKDTYIKIEYTN